jgi:lipoate-protein ligase A
MTAHETTKALRTLDLTYPSPAQNLACDEALLDACEDGLGVEILRFWEPAGHFVVLGYSNKIQEEIHRDLCRKKGVPVLRRCSGGGTVLQGPGCLNYSLVLRIKKNGLDTITAANHFIMKHHQLALAQLLRKPVKIEGHTDLAIGGLKFSGNAQRRKKHHLLFHGTFLLGFDLALVEKLLKLPPRRPEYRRDRRHGDFLMDLDVSAKKVKHALEKIWKATGSYDPAGARHAVPLRDRIQKLVDEKYSHDEWNLKY